MLFENENPYLEMILNLGENAYMTTGSNQSDLIGFYKGNMFENEYLPYKNLTYIKPKISSEREEELLTIMKYNFMVIDYNLYLDVHPDDSNILRKYKEAADHLEECKKAYIKKYGPLCITETNYPKYEWIQSPWPWDKEDGKYV